MSSVNKFSLSYKSSAGFKIFGKDWELLHEKCLYLKSLRFFEKQLIHRLLHIGHKLSQPSTTDDYRLIMNDLQERLQAHLIIQKQVENEIAVEFEALCKEKKVYFS